MVPAVIVIMEDMHNPLPGYFRAFSADSPDSTIVCTLIGYATAGGSHKTVKAAAEEASRLYPGQTIYRNGKPVKLS